MSVPLCTQASMQVNPWLNRLKLWVITKSEASEMLIWMGLEGSHHEKTTTGFSKWRVPEGFYFFPKLFPKFWSSFHFFYVSWLQNRYNYCLKATQSKYFLIWTRIMNHSEQRASFSCQDLPRVCVCVTFVSTTCYFNWASTHQYMISKK